ncbi:uncharacterized protein V1516DRAFT_626074 [Lipomyces oligophaga]|uniref:uncharacterized protein n=1 Tax=Lipomyces oligophaga TaxID=45792 RepID=UPI0034CF5D27
MTPSGYTSKPKYYGRGAPSLVQSSSNSVPWKVIHLYTPDLIAQNTPCTFHPNFLPFELANQLLRDLMNDSIQWSPNQFRLFNREVTSPHSTCFYVNSTHLEFFIDTYRYNGAPIKAVRPFSNNMLRVQKIVEQLVNEELSKRGYLKYQYKGKWLGDVTFCNRYNGPSESVGYHSDRLTYHGPMPVIASVSLGVTREFRLRETTSSAQTYSLHLPHNSLLIMHAPCQEKYKHSVISCRKVDAHPISGNSRINLTYRMYRDCHAPYNTPLCKCGIPMVLRCVTKKQESLGRYFWSCAASYQQEKGCDTFHWATFTDNGEPINIPSASYPDKYVKPEFSARFQPSSPSPFQSNIALPTQTEKKESPNSASLSLAHDDRW